MIGKCGNLIKKLPNNHFDSIFFNDTLEYIVDSYEVLSKKIIYKIQQKSSSEKKH